MKEIKGNILEYVENYDLICFTANSTVKKDGSLVMGRGNALAFKNKFKDIDKMFGKRIDDGSLFGMSVIKGTPEVKIGAFQTKVNWRDPSTYLILENSIKRLSDYQEYFPDEKIAICYPGIENGKLDKDKVSKLFEKINVDLFYL